MAKPYKDNAGGKKEQVAAMFNNIAPKYDFLNHFLSFGIDRYWRKKAISQLQEDNPSRILDVACGTGDFSITSLRLNPAHVTGIDISQKMLDIGIKKIKSKNLGDKISLQLADSENLPFNDNTFDAVIVAFGVRNFENLLLGLKEAHRVVKPECKMVILEFSRPSVFPVKQMYNFYFSFILPVVGRFFSKDKSAYSYLPNSVKEFPEGANFLKVMNDAGFKQVKAKRLTFGICSLYTGIKGQEIRG